MIIYCFVLARIGDRSVLIRVATCMNLRAIADTRLMMTYQANVSLLSLDKTPL